MQFRICSSVFERYQKERQAFVQKVAELANHSENIETLQNGGKTYLKVFYTIQISIKMFSVYFLELNLCSSKLTSFRIVQHGISLVPKEKAQFSM